MALDKVDVKSASTTDENQEAIVTRAIPSGHVQCVNTYAMPVDKALGQCMWQNDLSYDDVDRRGLGEGYDLYIAARQDCSGPNLMTMQLPIGSDMETPSVIKHYSPATDWEEPDFENITDPSEMLGFEGIDRLYPNLMLNCEGFTHAVFNVEVFYIDPPWCKTQAEYDQIIDELVVSGVIDIAVIRMAEGVPKGVLNMPCQHQFTEQSEDVQNTVERIVVGECVHANITPRFVTRPNNGSQTPDVVYMDENDEQYLTSNRAVSLPIIVPTLGAKRFCVQEISGLHSDALDLPFLDTMFSVGGLALKAEDFILGVRIYGYATNDVTHIDTLYDSKNVSWGLPIVFKDAVEYEELT